MLGTAKETHQQDPGVLFSAGSLLPAHQPCHALDPRSLAGTAGSRCGGGCHYHHLPYLEAQA